MMKTKYDILNADFGSNSVVSERRGTSSGICEKQRFETKKENEHTTNITTLKYTQIY